MHIFAVFILLNFNLTAISCKTSLQNELVQKCKFHIDWKHDRSQIVILKHQHVGNQFLLISLIMCHQHHQWNELVCLKQNQVCIHCPSCLEHFSSTKRGRRWKRWSSRRRGGSKRAGAAVKEETQGKQRLAEPESPPSLGYDWFFPCARMTKNKIKMVLLKRRWERKRSFAGMLCWLLFFVP